MSETDRYIVTTVPQCDCEIVRIPEDKLVALRFCSLHAAAPQLLAMLLKVEWGAGGYCLSCHRGVAAHYGAPYKHSPGCELEATIAAARGEDKA